MQLEVFFVWCKHAVECLRALQFSNEERGEESKGGSSGYEELDLNGAGVVEDKVRVNNTVVDNELGVRMWQCYRHGRKYVTGWKGVNSTLASSWKQIWQSYVRFDGVVHICVG